MRKASTWRSAAHAQIWLLAEDRLVFRAKIETKLAAITDTAACSLTRLAGSRSAGANFLITINVGTST